MTLHETILKVLRDHGAAMSASEIAAAINVRKLYVRKDGKPLPAGQVNSRVHNHPELFTKQDGIIGINPQFKFIDD